MPIPLGILAVAGAGGSAAGAYELISTAILGSDTASVVFTNGGAWAGYKHLQIRMTGRSSRSATSDSVGIRFNSDTASNYSSHWLFGDGSSVFSQNLSSYNEVLGPAITANSSTSSAFGAGVIDLLDISGTKNKTIRALSGGQNAAGIWLSSGLWRNTGSISTIDLRIFGGTYNFITGSRFSIYGIKG
jgi:hypothetical protein